MSKSSYIIPIFVPHMGCTHGCVFCNQKEITGQNTQPTATDVVEKLNTYLPTIPENSHIEIAYYGGSFTAINIDKQKELLTPAYSALEKGLIHGIRLSTRPDNINEDILSHLLAYGVTVIELGAQSTDAEVLLTAKRGHDKIIIEEASALIKSWGFNLGLQMMIGLPEDTPEKAKQTALDLIAMKPDFVRIYPALVVNNTELARMYQQGTYFPLSLGKAVELSKELLLLFDKAGIKVIRIGLQPSEEISENGEIIAGPFHPAFRELVESAVARDQLVYLIKKAKATDHIKIAINPADTSIVRGQKNSNISYLKEFCQIKQVDFVPKDYIARGTVVLLDDGQSLVCTRQDL